MSNPKVIGPGSNLLFTDTNALGWISIYSFHFILKSSPIVNGSIFLTVVASVVRTIVPLSLRPLLFVLDISVLLLSIDINQFSLYIYPAKPVVELLFQSNQGTSTILSG